MEKRVRKELGTQNSVLKLLRGREVSAEAGASVQQHCQFTYDLIRRLGLEYELQGHHGCVNCLQWSSNGRLLASGSDDTCVIIWDPMQHKQVQQLPTTHIGNIFSVKFLGNNDQIIATAAGDCRVIVQSVDGVQMLDCTCHKNRVKRLANSPTEPNVFWSAGEDGRVMQYDLREPHDCVKKQSNLLISYGMYSEIKCVAVNPTKPHYLALGINDPCVRMIDRRKIKTRLLSELNDVEYPTNSKILETNCVQYYVPGHLAIDRSGKPLSSRYVVTYVAFNAAGTEILVNMGGEQIYLFDVNNDRRVYEVRGAPLLASKRMKPNPTDPCKCQTNSRMYVPDNYEYKSNISKEMCPCYYMRRAFHLFGRKWIGDLYGAARDYLYVTQHWPNETKAYIGLIRCLIALGWHDDAKRWYDYVCQLFPGFEALKPVQQLDNDIEALANTDPSAGTSPQQYVGRDEVYDADREAYRPYNSRDYEMRFFGHCNTTTDIMEANFLGEDGNYICAGSDEGIFFIWERKTQSIVNALYGDPSIVNCLQPHPNTCLIASSGIDPVVKLWSPLPVNELDNVRVVKKVEEVVRGNQYRMSMDPFETLLVNMGYQMQGTNLNNERSIGTLPQCQQC